MRKMHQHNLAMGLCAMLLLGSTGCSNQGGNTETKQVPQTEKEQAAETTVAGEESSFDWKQFDGTTKLPVSPTTCTGIPSRSTYRNLRN